jgi:hypothetical protein
MVRAAFTSASKAYMVKVGGQSTMLSPGSSVQRMSRSINSSAPQPAWQQQQQQKKKKKKTCALTGA